MRALFAALLLSAPPLIGYAQTTPPVGTSKAVIAEAQRAGLPAKIGSWELVRHVPGENGHFLFASSQRTFSFFVTETKNRNPLQPQSGWKPVSLGSGLTAFLHKDSRNQERLAIAFKHQTQRRMILGKLTEAELVSLAKLLR